MGQAKFQRRRAASIERNAKTARLVREEQTRRALINENALRRVAATQAITSTIANAAPTVITDEETLDRIERDMTDEQLRELTEYRGGCSCHISPPCAAHSDPLTLQEAKDLGWLED